MRLKIGYFYPKELNLYGDNGNVEILIQRARWRNIDAEIFNIDSTTTPEEILDARINLVFMGGGPDSGQKTMYKDLLENKKDFLVDYVENEGVGLFICGAYQLMGHYYKAADGSVLDGLGIFDLYTQHFGNHKPRCIGNMVCKLNSELLGDETFKNVNFIGDNLVGFENHGGRTYLGSDLDKGVVPSAGTTIKPLAKVVIGHGNNGEDKTEGAWYKNSFGTYSHGPVLSKNPHFADYLIAKALKTTTLSPLDDTLIKTAHLSAQKLSK
jgi:lipid II isoglutaminyl synthase (glutamine-hydrolysing)